MKDNGVQFITVLPIFLHDMHNISVFLMVMSLNGMVMTKYLPQDKAEQVLLQQLILSQVLKVQLRNVKRFNSLYSAQFYETKITRKR